MRHRRFSLLVAAGAATVLPISAGQAGAASDDDEAVAAAIDAVADVVTDAGFVSDGAIGDGDPDVFDVVPDDESDAATSDYSCTDDIAALLADDGSLVGETAREFSGSFSFAPDATSTEVRAAAPDNVTAVALAVDDEGRDALESIVAAFGSGELEDCVETSFSDVLSSTPDAGGVTVETDDDLGIGDQSGAFTIANDSDEYRFDSTLLFTRVGNRLGMVVFYRSGGPDSGLDPTSVLAAMADALGE